MATKILFISNLFPNPLHPAMAPYNRQQIAALSSFCDIEVISPIPWPEFIKKRPLLPTREEGGVTVHHPVYCYPPRFLRSCHGEFFYYSIKSVAMRLLKKQRFDLVFSSWLYPDSWAAAKLAAHFDLPLFVKVHGTDVNRLKSGSAVAKRSLDVTRQAEKVICVSAALQDRLLNLGVPWEKLAVLYNGVDRNIFYPMDKEKIRQELKVPAQEFLVLYVGNMKKEKGIEELLFAFKKVAEPGRKDARLVMIGSGAYLEAARTLTASLGLVDKVRFLGALPLQEIALWMNAASVLCLPSYMEGVPNVVVEALSCGTKVIATNVGGIPELDSGNGMLKLVPPKESASLVDVLSAISPAGSGPDLPPSNIISWQENSRRLYAHLVGDT